MFCKFLFCCVLAVFISVSAFAAPGSIIVRQDNDWMKVYYSCQDSLAGVAILLQVNGGIPSELQWIDTVRNDGLNVLNITNNKVTILSLSVEELLPPAEHLIAKFKVSSPSCTIDTTRNGCGVGSEFCYLNTQTFVPDFYFQLSGVGDDPESNVPNKFELKDPYPNPFNPSTIISFTLPIFSHVNLTIYNMLGQKVVVLVAEDLSAGTYSITWNVKNEIASGIYFCVLKTNNFEQIRKMVLMK